MVLRVSNKIVISKYTIGWFLVCAYIFTSYVAQDVFMSSQLNSIFLYAFLAFSVFIMVFENSSQKSHMESKGFFVWYGIFMVVSAVLMLLSPSISEVFSSFYAMIVSLGVSLCLKVYIKTEQDFKRVCYFYSLSAFALVILLALTGNLVGTADDRLGQELTGNANIFATMMMVGAIFSIWLLIFDSKTIVKKLVMMSAVAFEMYAIALSGGRKFFIVPFVFLYILILYKQDKKGRRHILLSTILFTTIMYVVWSLIMDVQVFYDSIGIRMEGLIKTFQGEDGDGSSRIREVLRNLAIEKWLERPFTGYGFDSFKYLAQKAVGEFYYSHCNYTELLYSGGIFYFLLYYWIFVVIFKRCYKNKQIPVPLKAFAISVIACFCVYDYGGVTYNCTPQIILLMMAYAASSFKNIVPKEVVTNGENKNFI